jgi:hypothetical protein
VLTIPEYAALRAGYRLKYKKMRVWESETLLQFKSNVLHIIDSIPFGERNTARGLHEDLSTIKAIEDSKVQQTLNIELQRIESRDEMKRFFEALAIPSGRNAILHIECHGTEQGIQFADNSYAVWDELKPYFQRINEASRCNLFITLAACKGAYLLNAIQPIERSPFCGMIGPGSDVYPDELLKSYSAFYGTLLTTRDGTQALAKLKEVNKFSNSPSYSFWDAEKCFERVYRRYLKDECSEPSLHGRATALWEKLDRKKRQQYPLTYIAELLRNDSTKNFIPHKENFFFEDLFPENTARFRLTLQQVIENM